MKRIKSYYNDPERRNKELRQVKPLDAIFKDLLPRIERLERLYELNRKPSEDSKTQNLLT